MRTRKALIQSFIISVLLLGLVSMAGAWTYSIDTYSYYGSPALSGTVTDVLYHTKVAVIYNESTESEVLNMDLYYSSSFNGQYEYSFDGGVHWHLIDEDLSEWSKDIPIGGTIWLRIWLFNDDGNRFHVLSPSPWGVAAAVEDDEEYYFAFPPGSHYYIAGWVRDIDGFVAVIQPLP